MEITMATACNTWATFEFIHIMTFEFIRKLCFIVSGTYFFLFLFIFRFSVFRIHFLVKKNFSPTEKFPKFQRMR